MNKRRNLFWNDLSDDLRESLFEQTKQQLAQEKVSELLQDGYSLDAAQRLVEGDLDEELNEQTDDYLNRQGIFGTLDLPE